MVNLNLDLQVILGSDPHSDFNLHALVRNLLYSDAGRRVLQDQILSLNDILKGISNGIEIRLVGNSDCYS